MRRALMASTIAAAVVAVSSSLAATVSVNDVRTLRSILRTDDACVIIDAAVGGQPYARTSVTADLRPRMSVAVQIYHDPGCRGPREYAYGDVFTSSAVDVTVDPSLSTASVVARLVSDAETEIDLALQFAAALDPPPVTPSIDPNPNHTYAAESLIRYGTALITVRSTGGTEISGATTEESTYVHWSGAVSVRPEV